MIKNKSILIGDTVEYLHVLCRGKPQFSTVRRMELTDQPRAQYGVHIRVANIREILENRVLFVLDDGHWCYSEDIVLNNDQIKAAGAG